MGTMFSCGKEKATEPGDATTRGATAQNDSAKQGGVTITINDEWAGDTTINF